MKSRRRNQQNLDRKPVQTLDVSFNTFQDYFNYIKDYIITLRYYLCGDREYINATSIAILNAIFFMLNVLSSSSSSPGISVSQDLNMGR